MISVAGVSSGGEVKRKVAPTAHSRRPPTDSSIPFVPPPFSVPHVPSRLSLAFASSTSTSLSSSALLTLTQPEALSLALHLSTSSHLSSRYHVVHHLLLPLIQRWSRRLHSSDPTPSTLSLDTEEAEREERKEKRAADEKTSDKGDEDAETDVVLPLQQFLSATVSVVLTALPLWLDPPSHLHVMDLVQHLTSSIRIATPLLLSSLQTQLTALNKAASLLRYEREALAIADAVTVTVAAVREEDRARLDAVVVPVVTGTLLMLERVMEGNRQRYQRRVTRIVQRLLFHHPQLAGGMVTALTTSSSLFMLGVVLQCVPQAVLQSQVKALVTLYEQSILNSKEAEAIASHQSAFTPALRLMSEAEWTAVLMPTIDRMGKRNPELILPSLAGLIGAVRFDLSPSHKQLLPLLTTELKHSEEDRRKTAQLVLTALIRKTSDPATLSSLLTLLLSHLQGKSGVLSQWQLRASFLTAIGMLTQSGLGPSEAATLSSSAVEALCDFLDKEPSFEARSVGVEALTSHLRSVATVTDKALKHLTAGMSRSKDGNSIPAYLSLIVDSLDGPSINEAVRSAFDPLLAKSGDVLTGHIKNATAKPLQHRKEGLLSIALLLTSSSTASTKVCLPLLRDPMSFVNSPDLLSSCGVEEGAAYIRLFHALLKHQVGLLSGDVSALYQTMMRLRLHKQWMVRKAATRWIAGETLSDATLAGLLKNLEAIVNGKGGDAVSSHLYSQSLLSVFPTAALPAASIPLLLYIAADPIVCPSSSLCKQIIRHLLAQQPALAEHVQSQSAAFLSHLDGFLSSHPRQQQTAVSMLIALQAAFPAFTLTVLIPHVLSFLSPAALTALTEYDVAVYRTPEGELCSVRREGDVHLPTTESRNVRGRTKEDEEFARLKREIDKKKGKVDSDTQQRLTEQSQLRAKLHVAVEQVKGVLIGLERMSEDRREGMAELLPSLLPALYPLLKNSLVKGDAASLHRGLMRCLDAHVRSLSLPLTLSVQLMVTRGVGIWEDRLHVAMIRDVLQKLAMKAKLRLLTAPTWMYVSPLVTTVLMQSKEDQASDDNDDEQSTSGGGDDDEEEEEEEDGGKTAAKGEEEVKGHRPGFTDALTVFTSLTSASLHTGHASAVRYPLSDFLTLLLHLLNSTPSSHSTVSAALLSLAPALTLTDLRALLTDSGLFSVNVDVRSICLDALITTIPDKSTDPSSFTSLTYSTFILCHDEDEEVKESAVDLFAHLALHIDEDYLTHLLPCLSHPFPHIRTATSHAIAAALLQLPSSTTTTLSSLLQLFKSSADVRVQGRLRAVEVQSKWETRDGVALTLKASTPAFTSSRHITDLFTFFLSHALRDDHDTVWADILQAGLTLITAHGAAHLEELLPLFTSYSTLEDRVDQDGDEHWRNDRVREGAVIMMGTIARHMSHESEDLLTVMSSLVQVLQTPSHSVQRAVAECITSLMQHSILAIPRPVLHQHPHDPPLHRRRLRSEEGRSLWCGRHRQRPPPSVSSPLRHPRPPRSPRPGQKP